MAERKVRLSVKLFVLFPSWILTCLTWNLLRSVPNSVEILTWNFRKKLFRKNFSEILFKTKAIFYRNSWNSPYLQNFIWVRIALKKFAQVLSYVVCTQVRRHVHKQITKRRYGEEKPGRFVFGKPFLFTLGLGLTTPYSLGISVSNFYHTFLTVSIEFWMRFESQIRPTGFAINFLFITVMAERKVRFCVKLFVLFPSWILTCLTWNLLRSVPNSVEILTWNFRKKLFRENFSEILFKTKTIFYRNSWNFVILSAIFSGFVLCWKNSLEYFYMLFAPR